jgi:hypothetical protein
VDGFRQERRRRGGGEVDDGGEVVAGLRAGVAVSAEHVVGRLAVVEHPAGEHGGPDLVQGVLERGDNAEVAAAATQRPEEVGVLVGAGVHELPVRGDDVGADQAVAGEAAAPEQPADTAAEGEPGDPGRRHQPTGEREPELLRLVVEVAPQATGLRDDPPSCRVDPDPPHRRQVEDQSAVGGGEAGDAVPAAAQCQREPLTAGELDPADHVGDAGAADHQSRPPVVCPVPDRPGFVVVVAGRGHQVSVQALGQLGQGGFPDGLEACLGRGHCVSHRVGVLPCRTLGVPAQRGLSDP